MTTTAALSPSQWAVRHQSGITTYTRQYTVALVAPKTVVATHYYYCTSCSSSSKQASKYFGRRTIVASVGA